MRQVTTILRSTGMRASCLALLLTLTLAQKASGQVFLDMRRAYTFAEVEGAKSVERTHMETALSREKPKAEAIDSALKSRAKEEVIRFADRNVDVAWLTERSKIEGTMTRIQNNISKITMNGGSMKSRNYYDMEYKKILSGIQLIQDSYQDNSLRKREYEALYADARKLDHEVYNFLKKCRIRKDALNAFENMDDFIRRYRPNVRRIATTAHNKWMQAANPQH